MVVRTQPMQQAVYNLLVKLCPLLMKEATLLGQRVQHSRKDMMYTQDQEILRSIFFQEQQAMLQKIGAQQERMQKQQDQHIERQKKMEDSRT